jgi:hypothetical protein
MGFVRFSVKTVIISLNSVDHLMFVMVKLCVVSEERIEYFNYYLRKLWLQILCL